MSPTRLRTSIALLALSSGVLLCMIVSLDMPETARRSIDASTTRPAPPEVAFDEPEGAAEYQRMKRQGASPGFDTIAAYRVARAHLEAMPRHSTQPEPQGSHGQPENRALAKSTTARALGRWTPIGPGNIGGRTRTLVIHPTHPETMYAGGVSGGVWKTTDGGQAWTPLADRIANITVNSMAIHPEDPEVLYVGTGEGHFREIVRGTGLPLRGEGIFKTEDGGATWSQLPSTRGEPFHWVNDLIVSPRMPSRIYAATRSGVYLSENDGRSWDRLLDPGVNGGCLDLALRTDLDVDWLFASCGTFEQATVYRRKMTRNGEWEAVLSEPGMGRTSLAIAPSDQTVIYALSASNLPGLYEQALHAVYRSTAGGSAGTWSVRVDNTDDEKLNTLLLTNPAGASYEECGWGEGNSWTPMGWYCNVIAVDPTDPDVVWAGGVDLFRSDDGGETWGLASYWWRWALDEQPGPSYVHADQHAIVFHPDFDGTNVTTMFSGNDGGIFRTDNPYAPIGHDETAICDPARSDVVFENLNHGLGITQFYHGAPFPGGEGYLGGTQDNGTILGLDQWGPDGWLRISGGDGGYVAIDPTDPQILYVESQGFGFRKSIDGGLTFESAVEGITENRWDFLFITPFVMDPNESTRLWTGGRRLWRTDDSAAEWMPASINPLGSGQISALAVELGNSQLVLVGTTNGFIHRNEYALMADAETVWPATRPREGFVSSLAFDATSPGVVYATYAGFGGAHVWRSEDGGGSWMSIDGSGAAAVPDIPVHSIVIDPANPGRLYLGTDLGVLTSISGGRTWAVENTGFANVVTEWLSLGSDVAGSPWLFAFTHGRGAWKVDLSPVPPEPRAASGRRSP